MPSYSTLNSNAQSQCGAQLRTFSKAVNFATTAYTQGTGGNSSGTGTHNQSITFSDTSGPNSTYNNDLDTIASGVIIRSQDVIDSFANCVRGTVDRIEGRIGNQSDNAYICHTSCHSSCHTSRGRR